MPSKKIDFDSFSHVKVEDDIQENVSVFCGFKVEGFEEDTVATDDPNIAYQFYCEWGDEEMLENLNHYLASGKTEIANAIVFGMWSWEGPDRQPDEIIEFLCENKNRFPNLKAIYLGDITRREQEMSWICQSNLAPLLDAFPNLECLRTRGSVKLEFSSLNHPNLRALAIESGGLHVEVIQSICRANLPNLEYLEIWLGPEDYGCNCSVEDLQPILQGDLFPKLSYLGLRNSDFADAIAAVVVNSPVARKIKTLDLSLGTLSDEGGNALLNIPTDGKLENLNLHYNFVGEEVRHKLEKLPMNVDVSNSQEEDEDEARYVAIGE